MLNLKAILCNALHFALNLGASYAAGLVSIRDLLTPLVRMEHTASTVYCALFVCSPSEHVVLVSKPFKDWKHATERFMGHFLNIKCDSKASYGYETHKMCAESVLSLQRVFTSKQVSGCYLLFQQSFFGFILDTS